LPERNKKRISEDLQINSPLSELKGSLIGMVVYVGMSPSNLREFITSLDENEADNLALNLCGTPDGQTLIEVGEELIENMESV